MGLRAVAILALVAGCYDLPMPLCGFSCIAEGECPDGYTCNRLGDGFCHLNGFPSQTCPGHEGVTFDNTPPFAVTISPDPFSPLELNSPLIVRFSESVVGVDQDSFFVTASSNGERLLSDVTRLDSVNWELTTVSGFRQDETFTVTLTSDITDLAGNALTQQTFSYFTQTPSPPMFQGSVPNPSEVGVNVGVTLQLFFDKPAVNIVGKFHVSDQLGNPVTFNIDALSGTQSPFFQLRWQLGANTTYTAVIDQGLTDAGGHATSNSTSFNFTTGPDNLGPRVWGRNPGFDALGVPVGTFIEIDFDEDALNVGDGSIVLQKNGVVVPSQVAYNVASKIAIVRPDDQLDGLTVYDVFVTTAVTDAFGNASLDGGSSFQTAADKTAPRIRSTTPRAGSTSAPVNTTIAMTFDEPTQGPSLSTLIVLAGGSPITGTLAATNGDRTWTFTPDSPLPALTTIDVEVHVASDAFANATSYVYSFTTGP